MRPRAQSIVYSVLGGLAGAGCMTVVRSLGHRLGLYERTTPQAIEQAVAQVAKANPRGGPVTHHLADQAMHMGYAGVLGAVFGGVAEEGPQRPALRGMLFGLATWVLGANLMVPLLRAAPPSWRRSRGENAVDVLAHLLFGWATILVRDQLMSMPEHGPQPRERRMRTRTA
jgi:hypothetical protein